MAFCLYLNRKMRYADGGYSPQGMLEEGWAGLESHWDALLSPSTLGAANQDRVLLLPSMDLAQHMPRVWGHLRGPLCFPTGVK